MRSTRYSITTTNIVNGTIKNEDIDPNANIAKSKLAALNLTDADISDNAGIAISKLASPIATNESMLALAVIFGE